MSRRADEALRGWVLPGLPASALGGWLTVAAMTAMLLSRVMLLPDGPWEQDEALFAAGVLDFDVTRHRPHPPGFPGWIGIGKLLLPVFRDPVLALQVASSVASVATFWALARLLDRILPGGRATVLAAAFAMSPLVWIHAGRAFSTTPAVACAVLALLAWGGRPRAHLGGWALLAFAALIRPQLLPELAVLCLAGLASQNVSTRVKLGGIGLAVGLGLLGVAWAFAGDAAPVARAFADHFGRHRGGLAGPLVWAELGIVRGLGHPAVAAALAGLVVAGLWRATLSDRTHGAWLLGLVAVTAWMIVRQHHPGFPRYAVALLAACMPGIAWAIASLPRRFGMLLGIGLALLGGVASLGPLMSMHATALPVVAAARIAANDPDASALAYSHGVFSFARLEAERAALPIFDVTDAGAPPRLPVRAYAIEGRTLHALDGVTACALDVPAAPERAMVLGQGRFASARLTRDAVFLGANTFGPERDDAGDRFAWLAPNATLALPAGSERLNLRIDVPEDLDGAKLRITIGPDVHQAVLRPGPMSLDVSTPACALGCDAILSVDRQHRAPGDPRALTVQLEGAWIEGPDHAPAYGRWSPGHPRTVRAHDVALEGFEAPEVFAQGRRGAWTQARAYATLPARPGVLRIRLARPQHTPGDVTVATDADTMTVQLGPQITTLTLRTEAPEGRTRIDFRAPTFVPAEVRKGSDDRRNLGLILYDVEFLPDGDPCQPDDVSSTLEDDKTP